MQSFLLFLRFCICMYRSRTNTLIFEKKQSCEKLIADPWKDHNSILLVMKWIMLAHEKTLAILSSVWKDFSSTHEKILARL